MNDALFWREIKNEDIPAAESLLFANEKKSVSACARFLSRDVIPAKIWVLTDKKKAVFGACVKSRNTVMPVLCARKEIPRAFFLKKLVKKKKIHSVQGLKEDVLVFENEMKRTGAPVTEIYDYDLMSCDTLPGINGLMSGPSNLVLRIPTLDDLDKIAALQAAYEKEEVVPKGSVFSPEASKINIANIIVKGKILAAVLGGEIIGKINVSGASFTRYQVGGVYVRPDLRGLGIARRMAAVFITLLVKEGRGVTLFVKKNNIPARKLYSSLGFDIIDDYRITYY